MNHSFSLIELIDAQGEPFWGPLPALGIFQNPIACVCSVLVVAFMGQRAQLTRPGAGDLLEPYTISASGPIFLAHRVFAVVETLSLAALITVLFFGGWLIPGVDRPGTHLPSTTMEIAARIALFQGKMLLVSFGVMYLRRLLPKLHYEQALRVFWFILFPIACAGIMMTTILQSVFS
jgi:NADH-quinone oxidoreductase subunit H